MKRQTRQPDEWVVSVDGGYERYEFTMGQTVVLRRPVLDTKHSMCENLMACLSIAKGDIIFIVEDDDWYGPTYIERLAAVLEGDLSLILAGAVPARAFNLRYQGVFMQGAGGDRANLGATAMRRAAIPTLTAAIAAGRVILDGLLWHEFNAVLKGRYVENSDPVLYAGMKAMPGAAGITRLHRRDRRSEGAVEVLRQWIGEDVECYLPYMG